MKVLVSGGRDFENWEWLYKVLDRIHAKTPISLIIHGGAIGADKGAGRWADEHLIRKCVYPAAWGQHGPSAGPIRNQQMLDEGKPDLVVLFPGGKGTADMRSKAVVAGVKIYDVVANGIQGFDI